MSKTGIARGVHALCVVVLTALGAQAGDRFETAKEALAAGSCTRIEFLSIIESDIFDQVDTARGSADIARDGRYRIVVGDDEYLSTGDSLYSYSARHRQVTVEALTGGIDRSTEISFVIRLDDFFKTVIIHPDSVYRLIRTSVDVVGLPDSLVLFMRTDTSAIDRIEYLDVNGELNRIVFLSIVPSPECTPGRFEPDFPDSVDVIRLN